MDDELPRHLVRLGLDEGDAAVYAHLLATGPTTATEVAESIGRGCDAVRESLRRLARTGLIGGSSADDHGVVPVQPNVGIELLARERESELRASQAAALTAYDTFRRAVWTHSTEDLVEVVSGKDITHRVRQIERTVTTDILRFDSPPYHMPNDENPTEQDNLARGIEYRVVYARSSVENRAYYEANILPCIAAGEIARVLPTVPVKLSIIDRRMATVSLTSDEVEVNRTMLVVHAPSLLSALIGLFETSWRSAFPMHLGDAAPSLLRHVERTLLALLATGVPDDTIAELLGISRRTLTRHMERLMATTGATTRFQLALRAAHNGWL